MCCTAVGGVSMQPSGCEQQQWSSPANCQPASCNYQASWVVEGTDITFTISARQDSTTWTGIAFANLPQMVIQHSLCMACF